MTKTATVTATSTVTPAGSTITATVVLTGTSTYTVTPSVCSTTTTTSLTTTVFYPTRGADAGAAEKERRNNVLSIPSQLTAGCAATSIPQVVSSACSCFLKATTTSTTRTTTVTVTAAAVKPVTTTATALYHVSTTVTSCTSYSTSTVYSGQVSCGVASPTLSASGQITCTSPAPPGETNGRLRIEGDTEGTIFEDCISSGPSQITTPSGGTHECDGTNDDANPNPGATCTTQLNSAAALDSFPYDGTYSDSFQDYFITSIDQTTQTSTEFWGLLQDRAFTPVGGCQQEIAPGGTQETLWAFNAFNVQSFLSISPEYEVVSAGTKTVQVTVSGTDGSGSPESPFAGASIQEGGQGVSNAQGAISISVPSTPGCYQYKATANSAIRSNAFYLTVL